MTTDALPAAEVVASLMAPNRPTDGVAPDLPSPATDQAPESQPTRMAAGDALAPAELDTKGNPFDPSRHHVDPVTGKGKITARGTWQLKGTRGAPFARGNKAAVRPAESSNQAPQGEGAAESHDQAQDQAAATPPPRPNPQPAGFIGTVDPEVLPPAPESQIPRDQYRATAEAAHRALFGVLQITFGKAWEPDNQETKAWVEAWQEALWQWQAPRLGPVMTLLVLAVTSTAKRKDDDETRRRFASMMTWFRLRLGMRLPPAQVQPQTQGQGQQSQVQAPRSFAAPGAQVYNW